MQLRSSIRLLLLCGSAILAACSAQTGTQSAMSAPATASAQISGQGTNVEQPQTEAIDHVWSGQRVWFDFVEQNNHQMIAYYDAARQMSVAVRIYTAINLSISGPKLPMIREL